MVKCLVNFLFVFLFLSPLSLAKEAADEAFLQKEYGHDLTKAPFFLRFAYYKEFNKDWGKTDYLEREVFLEDYEKETAAQQAKQKAEAQAEALKEKERLQQKKEALRKEREKLKAQLAKEKAEQRADAQRQKEFDDALKEQKKELEQMEKQQAAP